MKSKALLSTHLEEPGALATLSHLDRFIEIKNSLVTLDYRMETEGVFPSLSRKHSIHSVKIWYRKSMGTGN